MGIEGLVQGGGGGWGSGGCKPRIEGIVKRGVRVQSGGRVVGGGMGGCERKIEVIVKMQKKSGWGGVGGLVGGGGLVGASGWCGVWGM